MSEKLLACESAGFERKPLDGAFAQLLTLWFYDWSKKDWLGIEAIKELKVYDGTSRFGRFLAWTLRSSEPVACVAPSVTSDPFITTVYLRRGKFNGMTRRDWTIFWASWFIGNAYWILACYMGISFVEWVWLVVRRAL